MKNFIRIIIAIFVAHLLLMHMGHANAAEIKLLSGFGMREVLLDLGPKFERATGHKLVITYGNAGPIIKRIQDGENFDAVFVNQPAMDSLVKEGKVVTGNVMPLVRSGIGLAVRKGATKPDISTPEALKRTLLAAKTVSYVPQGVSGIHFVKVLDRLGIADEVKSKAVFPKSVDVGLLIANGEAEIGVQLIQELVSVAGIEIVGPLPGDLQLTNAISAGLVVGAKDAVSAKALIEFLRTPDAAKVITAKGMEPG